MRALIAALAVTVFGLAQVPVAAEPVWPPGTEVVRFENLEGMILVDMTLRGSTGRDTSGAFVLDTGAGYLALDRTLAGALGIADTTARREAVDLASAPLPRLTLGRWVMDQVDPVLTVDASIIRRVSDREVLGLLGQKPLRDRLVWLDYRKQLVALVPAGPPDEFDESDVVEHVAASGRTADDSSVARSRRAASGALSRRAISLRFRLVGDGKILVRGRVSDPRPPRWSRPLNLLLDTGATKCVLFADQIAGSVVGASTWPSLRGFTAPTLIGSADARIVRIPEVEITASAPARTPAPERGATRAAPRAAAVVAGVDAGVIVSDLAKVLSQVTREPVHGLIGYSFLKRFRVAIDYPHRVLWLDPIPNYRDDRPFEYSHVGLQLERRDRAVIVSGVADGSPAAQAGIARGDELVSLDGTAARGLDLEAITRRMEGPRGTSLTLVTRRGSLESTHRLVRRRLL